MLQINYNDDFRCLCGIASIHVHAIYYGSGLWPLEQSWSMQNCFGPLLMFTILTVVIHLGLVPNAYLPTYLHQIVILLPSPQNLVHFSVIPSAT
jgi:uncharacterized membrane protein